MCNKEFKFELKNWNNLSSSEQMEYIRQAWSDREKWIEDNKYNFKPIIIDHLSLIKS